MEKGKKEATKKAPKAVKAETVKLDHLKRYKIESNGTGPRMGAKGSILNNVGGQAAELMINNGFGKILK